MKKKFLALILVVAVSASMLAGCGTKAGEGETSGGLEVLFQCVEEVIERERNRSYFAKHGVFVPEGPVSCTVDGLVFNGNNPWNVQNVVDSVWQQTNCYTEPAEEDGYQFVHFNVVGKLNLSYRSYNGAVTEYNGAQLTVRIYDWYTGRMFPTSSSTNGSSSDYSIVLEIDGEKYDISYTEDCTWQSDDWSSTSTLGFVQGSAETRMIESYVFKVPEGYDGLVFGIIPTREYAEVNYDGMGDAVFYAPLETSDADYVEGIEYFRINRSQEGLKAPTRKLAETKVPETEALETEVPETEEPETEAPAEPEFIPYFEEYGVNAPDVPGSSAGLGGVDCLHLKEDNRERFQAYNMQYYSPNISIRDHSSRNGYEEITMELTGTTKYESFVELAGCKRA